MSCLPSHGRVNCTRCFGANADTTFDKTQRVDPQGKWRITWNPLAWGNENPEIVVLGFSKGPTQAGALTTVPHEEIAYKGSRTAVGKILAHIGVIAQPADGDFRTIVDQLIGNRSGTFHFGSFVRCTVERRDEKSNKWVGSGGGMLENFVATPFGQEVARNCADRFLRDLPGSVRLVIMFGLGTRGNYVRAARKLIETARPGNWKTVNEVSYTDGRVTVVHVEHFASQGALIPNWLGENQHERATLGRKAQEAVSKARVDQISPAHATGRIET